MKFEVQAGESKLESFGTYPKTNVKTKAKYNVIRPVDRLVPLQTSPLQQRVLQLVTELR